MTEAEWLACESPVALLAHLNVDGYSRKLLLYASTLCQLRTDLLTQRLLDWHAMVESVLRGVAESRSLDFLQEGVEDECSHLVEHAPVPARAYFSVLSHVVLCSWSYDPLEVDTPPPDLPEVRPLRQRGTSFIRDIFGNPFRPISFSPEWRTSTAVAIAQGMYESRDFSAMPILADALQDAGCDNDDILNHCRDEKQGHVRGCWVVDGVLNKS